MSGSKPFYRPDIDGLRAIAVSSVLIYHYWPQNMPGGYVGVDIFFVISGYLLSAIVISEVETGRFTFSGFYERRIRRIFPALFAMLAVTMIVAWRSLLPVDLISFCNTLLAASLSGSNFYLGLHSNYFDGFTGRNPLLHTWSLGVEEQFYVFLPIFVVLVHRFAAKHLRKIVVSVALVSLLWSIVEVRVNRNTAFYFPISRAWELLLGTMLSLRVIPIPKTRRLAEFLSIAGVAGIGAAVFLFTSHTDFPGESALLPCLGSAAIILTGELHDTLLKRVLSWKPFVFIGLISYSLYLWHWPVLIFSTRYLLFRPRGYHALLALVSVVLAILSWRLVETPFRSGLHRPVKRTVLQFGAVCILVFVPIAMFVISRNGLPGRFSAEVDTLSNYGNYRTVFAQEFGRIYYANGCFVELGVPISDYRADSCMDSAPDKYSVLVMGDSHAADLSYGLTMALPGIKVLEATLAQCHPESWGGASKECREFQKLTMQRIAEHHVQHVLLEADWGANELDGLTQLIAGLRQEGVQTVVVVGPRPEYGDIGLPDLLAHSIIRHDPGLVERYMTTHTFELDRAMNKMADDTWRVPYISLVDLLCHGESCVHYAAPGVPLQFDYAHFTALGAEYVGHRINDRFPGIFPKQ